MSGPTRTEDAERPRRWRFAGFELDEFARELRRDGAALAMEARQFDVLVELLRHAGDVVSKDDLLDSVWVDRDVTEHVLTQTISRVRAILGDQGQELIRTVHGVGYRLLAMVETLEGSARAAPLAGLQPGAPVPGRPDWILQRLLGQGGFGEVWLAQYGVNATVRVFKFAAGEHVRALKREISINRLLTQARVDPTGFVAVLGWNLDHAPYFIECEFVAGGNLRDWSQTHGGVDALPLDTRLALLAQVADVVADAHALGILHKDLKPANVLVRDDADQPHACLGDFGAAVALSTRAFDEHAVTRTGFTQEGAHTDSAGTLLYTAPELLAGAPPTVQSDIFALGVMLYQLCVGDWYRALAPGWEADIGDELVREDVAQAAEAHPERRFGDARALARRLRELPQRRIEREREREHERAARIAELDSIRAAARVSWRRAAFAVMLLGALGAAWLAWRERAAANQARQEAARANAATQFVFDLFQINDPSSQRGDRLTANEILANGERRLRGGLEDQPALRATLLYDLSMLHDQLGQHARAEPLLREAIALAADEPTISPNTRALWQRDLARALWRLGQVEAALDTVRAARAEAAAATLDTVTDVLLRHTEFACLYLLGEFDQAEAVQRAALVRAQAELGANHWLNTNGWSNLGTLLMERERPREALDAFSRAITVVQVNSKVQPSNRANIALNAAQAHARLGEVARAEALYAEYAPILERMYGARDWRRSVLSITQGEIAAARGEPLRAAQLVETAVELLRAPGVDQALYCAARERQAEHWQRAGAFDLAIAAYRDVLDGRAGLAATHPRVTRVRAALAEIQAQRAQ